MPRFKWNDPRNGRLINRYVDFICKEYPTIAKGIVKQGIGDLNTWFSSKARGNGWGESLNTADCGCLVGTTCLVAMAKYPKVADEALLRYKTTSDGALALYKFIVEKTNRDTSNWENEWTGAIPDHGKSLMHDPLLVMIYQAGMAASEEGTPIELEDYDDDDSLIEARQKQVIDHIEHRIRTNLNLPYPKQKVA